MEMSRAMYMRVQPKIEIWDLEERYTSQEDWQEAREAEEEEENKQTNKTTKNPKHIWEAK